MTDVVAKGWGAGFSGLQSAEPSFIDRMGVGRREKGIVINRGPAGQTSNKVNDVSQPDEDLTGGQPDPWQQWIQGCQQLLEKVAGQREPIEQAAGWFAETILAGRMVHLFGAGHSRMLVEEIWPRYGSFPGFHPIVELSLTYHNTVVGANGQRQAMFLESQSGLAEQILRNFDLREQDSALVISSSGCNTVSIEMAQLFRQRGIRVVVLVSLDYCRASTSRSPAGDKLVDHADLVLDTGAPVGDAMVTIPGLQTPVCPGSTVGGAMVVNAIKAACASQLVAAGEMPPVLTASCLAGEDRSRELFEAAYDEHARRLARLFEGLGLES
jgi:uncharacterized phosphosugar-binding protein